MLRNSDVFLPVSFNRMSMWPGHRPGTRLHLRTILDKAAIRSGGLSLAERALLAVCECWSAIATQSLAWHLGVNPEHRLQSLATVYKAMGAKRAARAMERALADLLHTANDGQRQQRIAALELVMLKARQSVDENISRFAARLLPQPQALRPVRRPAAVATVAAAVVVAGVPRPAVAGLRRLPVLPGTSPLSRPHAHWRAEGRSAR